MDMQVNEVTQGVVVVVLAGRLDMMGAERIDLRFNAVAGSNRGLVVDLTAVTFLASIGIRTLLLGAKMMGRRGGKLVLLDPQPEVERVLDETGVTDLMPVLRDRDAAIAAVTP